MQLLRAVLVLAGVAVAGALGLQSGAVYAQAPAAQPAKIGSSLIGKLEGPEFVLDAAKYPKTFKDAPMLADAVKAGKLPAVARRLPEPSQLLVIKPEH